MSRLNRNTSMIEQSMIEQSILEQSMSTEIADPVEPKYQAKHPALEHLKQLKTDEEIDHLEDYVEVEPFK